MKNKTCCFTGHRKIPADQYAFIKEKTRDAIISLAKKGVVYFGTGGALGFDTIAAQCILDLKESYPDIRLILVLPCINQTKGWRESDIQVYNEIKERADKVVYTSNDYYDGCMLKRNRHLVDNSGYCICYLTNDYGGTAYTVKYAKENHLEIINVADNGVR